MKNHLTSQKIERLELLEILTQYDIPVDVWGKGEAKTIDHLVDEIHNGETVLIGDKETNQIIREFSFLAITITCNIGGTMLQLVEERQVFLDGRERKRSSDIGVGEKLKQGENNIDEAVKRALHEELGIESGFSIGECEHVKEEVDSKSYPGIKSRRNRFSVSVSLDRDQYRPEGYIESQSDKTTYFVWKKIG